jgi:hypothetical protein
MSSQPMDKKILNVCGSVGAIITFFVTFIFNSILLNSLFPASYIIAAILGANLAISLLMASVGYIAGRMGAKNPTVVSAFRKGRNWFFFAAAIYVFPISIINYLGQKNIEPGYYLFGVFLILLSTGTGSLVFGTAAIFARDYRQFHRLRLPPQFSINEILTVTTLIAVIFSSIVSIRYFVIPSY